MAHGSLPTGRFCGGSRAARPRRTALGLLDPTLSPGTKYPAGLSRFASSTQSGDERRAARAHSTTTRRQAPRPALTTPPGQTSGPRPPQLLMATPSAPAILPQSPTCSKPPPAPVQPRHPRRTGPIGTKQFCSMATCRTSAKVASPNDDPRLQAHRTCQARKTPKPNPLKSFTPKTCPRVGIPHRPPRGATKSTTSLPSRKPCS